MPHSSIGNLKLEHYQTSAESVWIRIFPALVLIVLLSIEVVAGAQEQGPDWEILGHVLHADTGAPISGAKVSYRGVGDVRDHNGRVVNPPTLQGEVTTDTNGTYRIKGLPQGNYRIRAIATGFLAGVSSASAMPPEGNCRSCPPSQSADLKLRPDTIHQSTMNLEAFRLAHSQGLLPFNLMGVDSSFSPDGKLLVMALHVRSVSGQTQETWLYNLPTDKLKVVEYPAVASFYARGLLWQGDQLYMQATSVSSGGQQNQVFASASFDSPMVKVIPAPPPAVQAAYAEHEKEAASNSRFRVWAESSCDINPGPRCGQGTALAVEDKTTRQRRIVSPIHSTFFFDAKNSMVIYVSEAVPPSGWQHGVTTLDLATNQQRVTLLPGDTPIQLMAEQRVPNGYLIAYSIQGDCNPAATDQPESFDATGLRLPEVSVCFATIPSR